MDSAKLCKSVIMEIRPRLQSVNVYITLTEPNTVTVNLNLDSFEIVLGSLKQTLQCSGFYIVPKSLSCFSNKENYATFRFSTENVQQHLGTSRFEIVETDEQTCPVYNSGVFIKPNVLYNISCCNCAQSFCKDVTFERVLPFPDSSDSSDWFCHAHGSGDKTQTLVPKLTEAFYSHSFVHLHKDLLLGFVNQGLNLICKRCLAWIGTKVNAGEHKVWFNTVVFSDENNNFKSTALEDVFKTIHQSLSSSLLSSIRIVLSCQSSASRTDFILLWILEKKLRVSFDCDQSTGKIIDDVCKVLFKFEDNRSDLVCQWLGDVNVNAIDISKPMMVKLLEHLYAMNRYIPKDFSTSNDFYISYLLLYRNV